MATRGERRPLIAVFLLTLAGLAVLAAFNPATTDLFPPCPFHAITGLYCPGCGSLRAVHRLLHGDLWGAFRLNPLMVVSLPFLAYPLASAVFHMVCGRPLPRVLVSAAWVWIVLAIVILYGIFRNIPHYPFTLLTPS